MKKRKIFKIFALTLIFLYTISYSYANAASVSLDNVGKLLGAYYAGDSTTANYTKATGARKSSTYGVRISLVKLSGRTPITLAILDVLTGNSRSVDSTKNKLGDSFSGSKYASTTSLVVGNTTFQVTAPTGQAYNLNFSSITQNLASLINTAETTFGQGMEPRQFHRKLIESDYYKLMIGIINKTDTSLLRTYQIPSETEYVNMSDENQIRYIKNLNEIYIMVEPISTVSYGSEKAWFTSSGISYPIANSLITEIVHKSRISSNRDVSGIIGALTVLKVDENTRNSIETNLRRINETLDSPNYVCNKIDKTQCLPDDDKTILQWSNQVMFDFNRLLSQITENTISETLYTGTTSNIGAKLKSVSEKLTGKNGSTVVDGSVYANREKIAKYLVGNYNANQFPKFQSSTDSYTWANMESQTYSLGIQLVHVDFSTDISTPKCSYDKNTGILTNPNSLDPNYCCYASIADETEAQSGTLRWTTKTEFNTYWQGKSNNDANRWQSIQNFKDYWTSSNFDSLMQACYPQTTTPACAKTEFTKIKQNQVDLSNILNKKCCYISAYDDNTLDNETYNGQKLRTYFDSNGMLSECVVQECSFTDTIEKLQRYKNGIATPENDCCNYDNYGTIGKLVLTLRGISNKETFDNYISSNYPSVCPGSGGDGGCTVSDIVDIKNGTASLSTKAKCCVTSGFDSSILTSTISDATTLNKLGKPSNQPVQVRSLFNKENNTKLEYCVSNTDYCTINSVSASNTRCCPLGTKPNAEGLAAYSLVDRLFIYNNSEANLKQALINKLGISQYNSICGGTDNSCWYEVDNSCPDCETNLITNTNKNEGETTDKVKGEDSTLLNVSDEIKNCIVKNKTGGSGYDSYYYDERTTGLSTKYCDVYCTQKISYNYPKASTLNVDAGRYILVGGDEGYAGRFAPIKTETTFTCRIDKIKEREFETDLAAAKEEVERTFKEYSNAAEALKSIGSSNDYTIVKIEATNNGTGVFNGKTNDVCDCRNSRNLGTISHKEECCKNVGTRSYPQNGTSSSSIGRILTKTSVNKTHESIPKQTATAPFEYSYSNKTKVTYPEKLVEGADLITGNAPTNDPISKTEKSFTEIHIAGSWTSQAACNTTCNNLTGSSSSRKSSNRCRCESTIRLECQNGYEENGKCYTVTCPSSTPTYNSSTGKCEGTGSYSCPEGYSYVASQPILAQALLYQATNYKPCFKATCPSGSSDTSDGRCISYSCPNDYPTEACEDGYLMNSSTGNCEKVVNGVVTTGKSCRKSYCPTGYENINGTCTTNLPCGEGYTENTETGKCERDYCPQGTVEETSTGKCVSYSCAAEDRPAGQPNGYLNKSKSKIGAVTEGQCVYDYCSEKNYDRYAYESVQMYKYGLDMLTTQTARRTRICENDPNYYENVFRTKKQQTYDAFRTAYNNYNKILDDYFKCFTLEERISQYANYDIDIKLTYENGSKYYASVDLDKTSTLGSPNKDYLLTAPSSKYVSSSKPNIKYVYDSYNEKLVTQTETRQVFIDLNRINSISVNNKYSYSLPSNADIYIGTNKSSKSTKYTERIDSNSKINNIDFGKHLPVAFDKENNSIQVTLSHTITSANPNKTAFENAICRGDYICNDDAGDGGGPGCIIPVYRPIDLDNPFPDQDGNNRQTGTNWCASDSTGCSNTNTLVKKVITNNRGVTTYQVYNLTPLYTFVLTPSMIKKIRSYNSSTTYGDYNLVCDQGTGRHCISLYLRGEPDSNGRVIENNLRSLGALQPYQSCALDEMRNSSLCNRNGYSDYYRTKVD